MKNKIRITVKRKAVKGTIETAYRVAVYIDSCLIGSDRVMGNHAGFIKTAFKLLSDVGYFENSEKVYKNFVKAINNHDKNIIINCEETRGE